MPGQMPFTDRYLPELAPEAALAHFHDVLRRRRSIRDFSDRPVSRGVIESLVRSAMTAPSGANKQPWRFVCVNDPTIKKQIRAAAEAEEREFYEHRATKRWLEDLAPLGTDPSKPFLEVAPWLIVVFKLVRGEKDEQHYYVNESVGIACGMLLAAAQFAGLATLTHTPSPMAFLNRILNRPAHERPYLLIPVGYAADDATVPKHAILRKSIDETAVFL